MRVTDASVLVDALVGRAEHTHAIRQQLLEAAPLKAPHVVDLEVVNSVRRRLLRGHMDHAEAERAIARLKRLPIIRHPHVQLLGRCWELRENVSPYDAAYVALAEALDVPLLTADARLASAPGIRCEVELLT